MAGRAAFVRPALSGTLAALVLVASPASAQTPAAGTATQEVTAPVAPSAIAVPGFTAGTATGATVSLGDAVQLTLRHQSRIALAGYDIAAAAGRLRSAQGLFDSTFAFSPAFAYTQEAVSPGFLKQQRDNRTLIKKVAQQFTSLHVALRDTLANPAAEIPRCPLDVDFGTDSLLLDQLDPSEISVGGINQPLFPAVNVDIEGALGGASLSDFCTNPLGDDPFNAIRLELSYGRIRDIDQGNQFGLGGILTSGLQAPREAINLLAEISEAVAARARLALERLGPLPEDQFSRSFTFDTSLTKPFRNGIQASLSLQLRSEEQNFRDKILDPSFGGAGLPPKFPSNFTVGLNVPLGKGRGSVTAAATERSARFSVGASTERARHTVSEEVYRTLLAYLNLVAAQENLRLLQTSADRQKSLVTLIDTQVRGGELARVEFDRARARAATVESSVAAARAAVGEARVSLAEAAGLEAGTMAGAPAAADRFAGVALDPTAVDALLKEAASNRRDVRALEQTRRASSEIARGAQADLRRRFDLSLQTGLANGYESELFRFLVDERNPIFSQINEPVEFDDSHRYYSPRGYYRALRGRWEPFIVASLSFELPFGNNAAKGRFAQTQATLRTADIQLNDRVRLVGENVVDVAGSLKAAFEGVAAARRAVEESQASLDGILGQLRAGEATLIDTLTTEEDLTRDQVELVRQQQRYFSTLARLRFETGRLVTFTGEGTPAETARFLPTEFVTR